MFKNKKGQNWLNLGTQMKRIIIPVDFWHFVKSKRTKMTILGIEFVIYSNL